MMARRSLWMAGLIVLMLGTSLLAWQWQRRGRGSRWSGSGTPSDRGDVPMWDVDKDFVRDTFTFARVRYDSHYSGRGGDWATDYPDCDFNFSLRLQQLTALKVNPWPVIVSLTEDRIFDYPFLYMIEPGRLMFSDEEVVALRKYCLRGGFLMVDDFWGDDEYLNFYEQIKRVFPDREPQEVPLEHEIFHCVYDLKEKPQLPSIHAAYESGGRIVTWEPRSGSDTSIPYYKAIYDDNQRIMVFICHNTDLGDGWEREGENKWYFEEFSVKKAYPLGINIVTYAMTH
ncbi:MAG: DUF4159 domain-containing protein [Pirellulaceae bacterium]|nr:DUF4159 domain-containing protein [Pirellulaceae bacterium]